MAAKAQIIEKALSLSARAVGIAAVDSINCFAPSGYRPDEKLEEI